jgi:hypothetical protein
MILNQEADEIGYRCAFACQKQGYIWHGKKTIDLKGKFTKTQIKKFFTTKGKELDRDYTLEPYAIIEEEHIVTYTLDRMIEKLYAIDIPKVGKVDKVNLWLSPSDGSNFRYGVANIPGSKGHGYKAGRPPKPHYLGFIRNRLIEKWGAKEIFGYEADDALGIYQNDGTIASHIDKDINMIPGHHYNHVTGEYYHVPTGLGSLTYDSGKLIGRGIIFFYAQLITGDATDNIPGIPKMGPKKAYDLLHPCSTERDCYEQVYKLYTEYYGVDNATQAISEVADLLFIVRSDRLIGRQYLSHRGWLI